MSLLNRNGKPNQYTNANQTVLTAISVSERLPFDAKQLRLWDIHRLSISSEHSATDVEAETAVFNRSFYPAADIFGNFHAFLANHNLAFFGVIWFNAFEVHYKS